MLPLNPLAPTSPFTLTLLITLLVHLSILSQPDYSIDCLSLGELHSSVPSNNRYKFRLSQEKSVRQAIHNLNHQQQPPHHGKPLPLIVSPLNDPLADGDRQYFNSLPVDGKANRNNHLKPTATLPKPTLNGIVKRQDEIVMDIPLEYTSDIPYEFHPKLWPSNRLTPMVAEKKDHDPSPELDDIYSQLLASQIADLLKGNDSGSRKKRTLVKRNNRSGLPSAKSNKSQNSRSNRAADPLSPNRSAVRISSLSKHPSSDLKHQQYRSVSTKARKPGELRKVKLNKIPLKSTLNEAKQQPIKGDLTDHHSNGKTSPMIPHQMIRNNKVFNSTEVNSRPDRKEKKMTKKQANVTSGFRKLDPLRSPKSTHHIDKSPITHPFSHQRATKKLYNGMSQAIGPRNVVKRSISPPIVSSDPLLFGFGSKDEDSNGDPYNNNLLPDEDIDDEDDSVDGENIKGDDDLLPELTGNADYRSIGRQASVVPSLAMQTNPWVVDEATRNLMRSLTVKRRKRGYNNDNDDGQAMMINDGDDTDGDQMGLINLDEGTVNTDKIINNRNSNEGDEDGSNNRNVKTNSNNPDGDRTINNNNDINNLINIDGLGDNLGEEITSRIISEVDEPLSTGRTNALVDLIDFGEGPEVPARIVKKDGVTLDNNNTSSTSVREGKADGIGRKSDERRIGSLKRSDSDSGVNGRPHGTTAATTKMMVIREPGAANGLGDADNSTNDTYFEEELSEGLVTFGAGDFNELFNETESVKQGEVKGKRVSAETETGIGSLSSSSTLVPERTETGLMDDAITNGSEVDRDEQLLLEEIMSNGPRPVVAKRKRSVAPYFGNLPEETTLLMAATAVANAQLEAQEEAKFIEVDEKLERIEETLLSEALDLIKSNLDGETGRVSGEQVKSRIESRLNAAYDLEDMRLALSDLHKTMQTMNIEDEEAETGEDQEDFNTYPNDLEAVEREAYLDSLYQTIPSGSMREADEEKEIGIITRQGIQPTSSSSFSDYREPLKVKKHLPESEDCKAVSMLTTGCSAVKDVVPNGPLRGIFGSACDWHEVCYTCGELFGLLSSDCDLEFLEQSRLACNDSSSCETASRLILMPLRSRRTFYKRKVSPLCYQESCIEHFLLQSKRKR